MGASVSTNVQKILNSIDNQLEATTGSRTGADCETTLRNVHLSGCSVDIINRCNAKAEASIDAISKALADEWIKLTQEQRRRWLGELPGIDVTSNQQEVQQVIINKIKASCQADATLRQRILGENITIKDCVGPHPQVKMINAGDATATCGVKLAMDTVSKVSAQTEQGDNLFYIILVVIIICIICLISISSVISGYLMINK